MNLFHRKQQHKMKTATSMMTRPMHLDTPVDYAERSGAAFLPTFESHVIVPFSEAIITGLLFGIPSGVIIFSLYLYGKGTFTGALISGGFTALIVGYIIATIFWLIHLGDYKKLLWYTEFAEGPEPQIEQRQVYDARVKVNNHWRHCDLPFDRDNPQALVSFAKGISNGITPFSERGAKEHGYSVQRFNELRDNLIKSNLAYWRDPNNKKLGLGLTRGGTALLRSVAQNPPADDYEPEGDDWAMSPEIVQK